MAIIGIVAVDRNGSIGRSGTVPWHFPSDMKFFREQTMGHTCVMGYKTWLSLKKPLKNRLNIVMSRASEIEPQEGVILLRDRLSVLSLKTYLACNLFIIGGEQIYRMFLRDIEKWVVTEIPVTVEDADTFMPKDFLEGFEQQDSQVLEESLSVKFYGRVRGDNSSGSETPA
ncbi:MAG TPA: dihydrofolate reductase [Pyrinomonadaceae bacterium]|jgi:dihydrofolate reductase|nr:dihydrofolate reductase [Pyrinomonadaceae bacterium]